MTCLKSKSPRSSHRSPFKCSYFLKRDNIRRKTRVGFFQLDASLSKLKDDGEFDFLILMIHSIELMGYGGREGEVNMKARGRIKEIGERTGPLDK